jgi:hypothetical protein
MNLLSLLLLQVESSSVVSPSEAIREKKLNGCVREPAISQVISSPVREMAEAKVTPLVSTV